MTTCANNKNNDISHQQTTTTTKKPCSFQNIFCCPYGLCFTIPLGFAVIAVVFATGASFSCDLFQVEYVNQEQSGIVFGNDVAIFTIGPFTVEDFTLSSNDGILISRDDCVLWSNHETLNDNDMDGWLRISRLFLWLVCVPAYLMTMSLCFGSCMVLGKRCLHCVSCSFISYAIVSPIILVCVVMQQQQHKQDESLFLFCWPQKLVILHPFCLVGFFLFHFFFYKFAYLSEWCQDANDCSAGRSLVGFIVALVFWIGGGIAVCFLHVRKRHDKSNDKKKKKQQDVVDDDDEEDDDNNNNNDQMKQQIHVEEPLAPPTTYIVERTIVEDDGTVVKVITETITNSDGSKTVSETREVLFQEEKKKKKKKVEEPSPTTNNIEERTVVEEDGTIVKVTTRTITNTDGSKQVMEERKVLQETNNNNNNDVVDTGIIQHDHNNNNDPNNNNTDIHDDGNSSTVFCQPVPNLCGAGW